MSSFERTVKTLLIGDSGVGKSSLLLRFTSDSYNANLTATIGIDFKVRLLDIDGKSVQVKVWDTAGQEKFRTITSSYFRGAQAVLLVFDVSSRDSFNNVTMWSEAFNAHVGESACSRIVVGNKADLADAREVSQKEAIALGNRCGMSYFETSARTGSGVDEAFSAAVRAVLDRPAAPIPNATADTAIGLKNKSKSNSKGKRPFFLSC